MNTRVLKKISLRASYRCDLTTTTTTKKKKRETINA